jgi:hypothetical protein
VPAIEIKESTMKTSRIRKILGLAALTALTLGAGAGQADTRGFQFSTGFPHAGPVPHGHPRPFQPAAYCPPRWGVATVDERQARQMDRIHEGLRSGQLTRHEARDLLRDQRQIERVERHYLADGRLSRDEWLDLDRRLDEASREIRAEKHDFDRNGHGYGHGGHRGWR